MREIASVAVRDGGENVFPIARSLEVDLGNAREILSDRIDILGIVSPEFVKIDLLIKIQVGLRPFAFARESGVINSAPVCVPRRAATSRWILHVRDRILQRFAGGGLVNAQRSVFASALRNRHRDIFAIA